MPFYRYILGIYIYIFVHWLYVYTYILRTYIYFYFMDCQPNHHCMSSGLARLGERRARSCGLGAPLAPGSLVIQQHEICLWDWHGSWSVLIGYDIKHESWNLHLQNSNSKLWFNSVLISTLHVAAFFFMCTCRRPQFALFVSWVHLPFDNVSNSHPVNILKTCKNTLKLQEILSAYRYTVRCQYCWLVLQKLQLRNVLEPMTQLVPTSAVPTFVLGEEEPTLLWDSGSWVQSYEYQGYWHIHKQQQISVASECHQQFIPTVWRHVQ